MNSNALMLIATGVALVIVAGLVTLLVNGYFRHRRTRLLGGQSAAQLRRSAEHIHLVAQACHSHTGNADIGRALHQLAIQTLENALRLSPRDGQSQRLLREYQERNDAASATASQPLDLHQREDETALSRARLLLTEASRLLAQIERDGWIEPDDLQQMRDNLHQARRATDLRLRLRHAAPAEPREEARNPSHDYEPRTGRYPAPDPESELSPEALPEEPQSLKH